MQPHIYEKPRLVTFGTLRDLTLLGLNSDCDGGVFGTADGIWWLCTEHESARS